MNKRGVAGVNYQVMDMLNMKFEDNSQDIVIDKGSFDALCCDKSDETREKTFKYLNEICRVLASKDESNEDKAGSFIVVSLLQDFLMKILLEFFVDGKGN